MTPLIGRRLNDNFRTTFVGGRVVMTQGSQNCRSTIRLASFSRCRASRTSMPSNDPHGEHDFGSFELAGETYFFKVDYYSPDLQGGSEDPADPEKTTRVLTIMRADEY